MAIFSLCKTHYSAQLLPIIKTMDMPLYIGSDHHHHRHRNEYDPYAHALQAGGETIDGHGGI
jgi:hypothetical protein